MLFLRSCNIKILIELSKLTNKNFSTKLVIALSCKLLQFFAWKNKDKRGILEFRI